MICWEKKKERDMKISCQLWFVEAFGLFFFLIMRKITLDRRKDWSLPTLK